MLGFGLDLGFDIDFALGLGFLGRFPFLVADTRRQMGVRGQAEGQLVGAERQAFNRQRCVNQRPWAAYICKLRVLRSQQRSHPALLNGGLLLVCYKIHACFSARLTWRQTFGRFLFLVVAMQSRAGSIDTTRTHVSAQ